MARLKVEPSTGWSAFIAWAVAGALWSLSFLSFIGPFLWPLAIALTWFLARNSPQRRDLIGLVAGAGVLLVVVGLLNLGYEPCPGPLVERSGSSCGGLPPAPFLAAGGLAVAASLGVYRTLRASDNADGS